MAERYSFRPFAPDEQLGRVRRTRRSPERLSRHGSRAKPSAPVTGNLYLNGRTSVFGALQAPATIGTRQSESLDRSWNNLGTFEGEDWLPNNPKRRLNNDLWI